jgi:hypothetical protein
MTPVYVEWKRVGNRLNSGKTERERKRDGVLQQKSFGMANKLGRWTNIYDS